MYSTQASSRLSRQGAALARARTAKVATILSRHQSSVPTNNHELLKAKESECPELPSTPSWSLASLFEYRDSNHPTNSASTHADITPTTIDQLLALAHLRKPVDPKELERLRKDLNQMRNFLQYIRATDGHPTRDAKSPTAVRGLRSLVDDGTGVRLRPSPSPTTTTATADAKATETERKVTREILLQQPIRTKGNFFVVGTDLDPKAES